MKTDTHMWARKTKAHSDCHLPKNIPPERSVSISKEKTVDQNLMHRPVLSLL